ncbi:MAG: Uma2 family endonuclease [Chloroflexi bacterium]|nr:Uma2 family endonuclease [Chloroflexota bacterium]
MTTQRTLMRFTADQYELMIAAGVLTKDDRVELLDGEVVEMAPIGPRHAGKVDDIAELLTLRLSDVARIRVQSPIRLDNRSEPEPDIAVLRRKPGFYADDHPTPSDVFLVIEVGDSSAESDREVKAPLYARAGIPELLLFDVAAGTVMVCRDPSSEGYISVQPLYRGDVWRPLAFPDREIAVTDMLGEG